MGSFVVQLVGRKRFTFNLEGQGAAAGHNRKA